MMPSPPNPGRLLGLSGSYWQTCALHAGVKLGLFTAIGRHARSPEQIAAMIDADRTRGRYVNECAGGNGTLKERRRPVCQHG